MIELQLVGYTADLEYLVFCDAAEGASRFKAIVDDDLLATLTEVVERTDPRRLAAFLPPAALPPAPPPPPPPPPRPPAPTPAASRPGVGPLAAVAVLLANAAQATPAADVAADGQSDDHASVSAPATRGSRLSPREIQALLRMGRTPAAIARQAGVDENWVQRWLPPIEAERGRIIAAARSARVSKARKGPSAHALGEAVDRNLAAKTADPDAEWSATRRDGDPYWMVAVRYRSRGKNRRARWRFDPDTREVEAEDTAARDLAWTPHPDDGGSATGTRATTAKRTTAKTAKTAGSKKAAAKKATAKKAAAKKTTAKKATAKKTTAKKANAKTPTGQRAPAKKRTAAKKTTARTAGPRPRDAAGGGPRNAAKKPAPADAPPDGAGGATGDADGPPAPSS